jgi:hypothetical protein
MISLHGQLRLRALDRPHCRPAAAQGRVMNAQRRFRADPARLSGGIDESDSVGHVGLFVSEKRHLLARAVRCGEPFLLERDRVETAGHRSPRTCGVASISNRASERARLPAGAQAAFWTLGTKDEPVHVDEIDIFESIAGKPRLLKSVINRWGNQGLRANPAVRSGLPQEMGSLPQMPAE